MHKPRKRFGQHFLKDPWAISQILKAIDPQSQDVMVEIGPGLGALTEPLLSVVEKLHAVELDRDLIPHLQTLAHHEKQLILHQQDILTFDLSTVATTRHQQRLIGNLPYNISTQLIFHFLPQRDYIKDMHFMLQKEVVDRMIAEPGSKTYGRLSVMVQYYFHVSKLLTIGPDAFEPPPKVQSAVVRLIPQDPLPYSVNDESQFAKIVREAFNHRRKTLSNALKGVVRNDVIVAAKLDPNLRPERLSVADFVNLTNISLHHNAGS